jgi:hypothetical protein
LTLLSESLSLPPPHPPHSFHHQRTSLAFSIPSSPIRMVSHRTEPDLAHLSSEITDLSMTDFHSPHLQSSSAATATSTAENHNRTLFSKTLPSSTASASAPHHQPVTIDQMMPIASENTNAASDGNGASGVQFHGTDFSRNGPMVENIFEIEVWHPLIPCLTPSPSHPAPGQ